MTVGAVVAIAIVVLLIWVLNTQIQLPPPVKMVFNVILAIIILIAILQLLGYGLHTKISMIQEGHRSLLM